MTEKQLITVLDNKNKDSYNIALTELIKNLTTRRLQY